MDMHQLNRLTDEQKRDYIELSRLFAENGWKTVVKAYQEKVNALVVTGANASSWEENRIAYGLRMAYEEILNLEHTTEDLFTQLSDAAVEAQQFVDEETCE